MTERISIIFVDDDPNVLNGLRRRMVTKRPNWTIAFCDSAKDALDKLDQQPADVVISDMRMPVMDGAEFLRIVAKRFPQTSRILLSGYADEVAIQNGTAATHHFLAKPCTDTDIIHAAERGLILQAYLRDPQLLDFLHRMPDDQIWPPAFRRLHLILQFRGPHSHHQLADFANDHPGLTALARELAVREGLIAQNTPIDFIDLVDMLGFESTKALCILWTEMGAPNWRAIDRIDIKLHRSLILGQIAADIARQQNHPLEFIDHVRAAALLCHIGENIFARIQPDRYASSCARADRDTCDIVSAEIAEIGIAHPAVSACLCALWGFRHEIVENIAFHHRPESAPTHHSESLLMVYAAQHFARKIGTDGADRAMKYDLATGFIHKCQAEAIWPQWEQMCLERHLPQERIAAR